MSYQKRLDQAFENVPVLPLDDKHKYVVFSDCHRGSGNNNDNYRVIVGVLDGENYSLLYVGDHEDAYRWGMNKRFVWNEHTQACQLITIEEKQEEIAVPKVQTDNETTFFEGVTEEKLLKIGVPEEAIARVLNIKSLDDLDVLEPILPVDAYESIFNIMDGEDIDSIIVTIEEGQAKENEDKLLSDNNKRRFVEITDDDADSR